MLTVKHMFKSLLLLVLAFSSVTAFAQSREKLERIKAAYMLAYGREPVGGEITFYNNQRDQTIPQYLNLLADYAKREKSFKRSLISKSYIDALGRKPIDGEINYWLNGTDLYYNLVNNHVSWLKGNPAEYEKVIKRSYQAVFGRQPNSGELNFWKGQPTVSYVMLVGCHEQWKRTNGNGNAASNRISNTSNGSVTVVPLTTVVANEVKNAANIQPGGNVISPGGGNVVAAGGDNLIAVGSAGVVAAGGLN